MICAWFRVAGLDATVWIPAFAGMTGEGEREDAHLNGQRPCGRDARAPGKTPLCPRLVRLHFYLQAQMAGVFADAAGGGFGEALWLGGADRDGDGDFGAVGV